ncbi:MAG: hypothetical protein OXQ31_26075 [Spirochaetaceae bacterium]|nr:hypothetical protein [Spirochaetaceae bacterium]
MLIDLDRGSLVEAVFGLPVEFVVPDLLYERELRQHGGEELRELGLRVEGLEDGSGVVRALGYRGLEPALSLVDSFALALAVENRWTLLTGDRVLRHLARSEDVDCHGLLWVLDLMVEARVVDRRTLYSGLEAIGDHPRCRLPRAEVNKRLQPGIFALGMESWLN